VSRLNKTKSYSYRTENEEEVRLVQHIESQPNQSQYILKLVKQDLEREQKGGVDNSLIQKIREIVIEEMGRQRGNGIRLTLE
jgi:hypothetical protein